MAYTQEQQQWIIAEANKRAISNGTSVAAEIAAEAQKSGMDMATAERNMGYSAGTLGGGAQSSGNLGLGGPPVANSPATPGTPYQLDPTTRASIVSQAEARARASGQTREQELYKYAQGEGINDAGVDTYMGFNPGTTANWAKTGMQSTASGTGGGAGAGGGGGVPAYMGVKYPNDRAADNRWQGDPYRNPDGSLQNAIEGGGGYPGTIDPRGGGNLGMGDSGYQRNPYLDAASRDIGGQMFDDWKRNVAPGIRSNAMATGGYGGSRQGVVEANSLNDLGRNYSQALTSMYSQDYTNAQNRGIQRQGQAQQYDLGRGGLANQRYGQDQSFALGVGGLANQRYGQDQSFALGVGGLANQRYGQDQSYDLGLGNLANQRYGQDQSYDLGLRNSDLNFASLDHNISNSNFNNQMTAANFGLGVQDYLNKNNATGVAAGTQINNTPWDYQKYLNSAGNQAGSGWNTSTTTKTGG